jgi:hypothetical protein
VVRDSVDAGCEGWGVALLRCVVIMGFDALPGLSDCGVASWGCVLGCVLGAGVVVGREISCLAIDT